MAVPEETVASDTLVEGAAPSAAPVLRVIPIGGLGEIGMNLMIYELGDSAILVDCGMMFPDAATMGVDVVIPDMTYIFENASRMKALFLTHGHEDHIGAVPFLVDKLDIPIYGMPLTLGFVRDKLVELNLQSRADLRELRPREPVTAGAFEVEAIRVTHSIVDAIALGIRTPLGAIIHTGDFKLDPTPVDSHPTDMGRLAMYGEEGTLLLVSDSTNAPIEGYSHSESSVGDALARIFSRAPGRIIVTTFASHIHRIQQVVNEARRVGRKVFFVGRSMVDNVETAERLRHLSIPAGTRGEIAQINDLDPRKVVLLTTGTQGEPTSALARMALNEHKQIQLGENDTVVISARTIPGNEVSVSHLIDHIYRRGAEVLYQETPGIHVSGHACQEELKTMLLLTKPKFFVPMHGTFRHLVIHARLAESVGVPRKRCFVITNGMVVSIDGKEGRIEEDRVASGKVFIDRQSEEVAGVVIRDRQHLSEEGFVIVVVALDVNTRGLVREPEIITRGLVHVDESADVLEEIRNLITGTISEGSHQELSSPETLQEKLRAVLKRYFRKKFERRPLILPVVWEM